MLKYETTKKESEIIDKIVKRAKLLNPQIDKFTLLMDITSVHMKDCPLKLDKFLVASDYDFVHDIFGIITHIDRDTGQLDGFIPRFAA